MDRITVFLLQFIIIGYANSENPTVQQSPSDSKFIYQASVQNSLNHHICNGVILNRNWILTLAQCVLNRNAGELKVFYGSNRLNHNGSYVDVKQIYIHPGFNKTIIRSDIALLLATTNITFIANISGSINLPAHDVPINREKLTASGWNASVSKYETFNSDSLFHANPILDHKQFRLVAILHCKEHSIDGMPKIESIAEPHHTFMVDLFSQPSKHLQCR